MLWNGKNMEKTKAMRISWQPSSIEFVTDQKQMENVGYFNYLHNNTCCKTYMQN